MFSVQWREAGSRSYAREAVGTLLTPELHRATLTLPVGLFLRPALHPGASVDLKSPPQGHSCRSKKQTRKPPAAQATAPLLSLFGAPYCHPLCALFPGAPKSLVD